MRIRVIHIQSEQDRLKVGFSSAIGVAEAIWSSMEILPAINHEHHVELDFDIVVRIGENAFISGESSSSIRKEAEFVRLVGLVEQIDDDGMLIFRLAADCIVMVESEGLAELVGKRIEVKLKIEKFRMTPFGV